MPVTRTEWNDEIVPTPFERTSEDADGVASPASITPAMGYGNELSGQRVRVVISRWLPRDGVSGAQKAANVWLAAGG